MAEEGVVPEAYSTRSASSKSVETDATIGAEGGSRPFPMPELLGDLKDGGETTAERSAFMGANVVRSIDGEGSRMDEFLSTSVEDDSECGDGTSYDSFTVSLSNSDDAFDPSKKHKCSIEDGCSSEYGNRQAEVILGIRTVHNTPAYGRFFEINLQKERKIYFKTLVSWKALTFFWILYFMKTFQTGASIKMA